MFLYTLQGSGEDVSPSWTWSTCGGRAVASVVPTRWPIPWDRGRAWGQRVPRYGAQGHCSPPKSWAGGHVPLRAAQESRSLLDHSSSTPTHTLHEAALSLTGRRRGQSRGTLREGEGLRAATVMKLIPTPESCCCTPGARWVHYHLCHHPPV